MDVLIAVGILSVFLNIVRFYLPRFLNKALFILAILFLIELYTYRNGLSPSPWMYLLFIGANAVIFRIKGTVISALAGLLLLYIHNDLLHFSEIFVFFSVGVLLGSISTVLQTRRVEKQEWLDMLMNQSKYLHVFRETSFAMQQTLQQDKLLHIILTSVTAGHGLGFNRAMIFMLSEDGTSLKGGLGIGPMTADEGYKTWEKISAHNLKLEDLIENDFEKEAKDPALNALLSCLEIPISEDNIFTKVLSHQKPLIIQNTEDGDDCQMLLKSLFHMNEFAVVPLVNQGICSGILLLDNIVNKRPIDSTSIENVIPLANQVAIALDHSNLYKQIEELASKDGLTGLHNQRALQTDLSYCFSEAIRNKQSVSILILDIDFFKHFNDNQGHLLGNEALKQLSQILESSRRVSDSAYRFGGEEFIVLLPRTGEEEACSLAEKIRETIEIAYFTGEETQPGGQLTVSIGAASSEDTDIHSPADLIEAADQALYAAKKSGKNRVIGKKEMYTHE